MDPPVAAEVETKSEKTEQAKSYACGLCDTEVVYRIAQELLPGLASACVDNTTGGLFTSAGTVAVDMRKEMTDYLTQRSETYVAEFLLSEKASMLELSEHPYDIILTLIDDFASSKTNVLSRVSELVLSERREDTIDDFVQEMEINGFWLLDRRECVASMLLKNVDYKNSFHCNMVCSSEEELTKHRSECMFRPMDCTHEGCTTRYCVAQKEHHEVVCPFMVLSCEQKCSDSVMRREMDRHCVTVCPMKLVHCAFYTVGCTASIPRCNVLQHNADDLSSHLLYIIRSAHKDASDEDLKHRVEQIRSLSNVEKLARARDTRALTYLIKDTEAKLGPLDVKTEPHEENNKKESPTKTKPLIVKDDANSPKKNEDHQGLQSANEMLPSTEKLVITENDTKLSTKGEPLVVKYDTDSPKKTEEHQGSQLAIEKSSSTEKPIITEDDTKLPTKNESSAVKDDTDSPKKTEEHQGSQSAIETSSSTEKPVVTKDDTKFPTKSEPSVVKDNTDSPSKTEEHQGLQSSIETTSSTLKPLIEDDTKLPTKNESSVVKNNFDSPNKLEEHQGSQSSIETTSSTLKPLITEDDTKLPTKSEPSVIKDNFDSPNKTEEHQGSQPSIEATSSTLKPIITEYDTKLPTKSEPSVVKDNIDSPKKTVEHQGSHTVLETTSTTEKLVITEDETPVKMDGNKDKDKDKDGSSSSPIKNEHNKELTVKEQTTRSPEGEKVKDETLHTVKDLTKQLSISDEEQTEKSFNDDKSEQFYSDEEDTKNSPGKESFKSDKEESKKSTEKEMLENTHESFSSDDEESMKSPLEEAYHDL